MADLRIIWFPVSPPPSESGVLPFTIQRAKNDYLPTVKPDWSTDASNVNLNIELYLQFRELSVLTGTCEGYLDLALDTVYTTLKSESGELLPVDTQCTPDLCQKFLKIERSYLEVMSRDEDAYSETTSKDFNVQLWAVVLLQENVYQGHIYVWRSPVDVNMLLVMGIRSRVDSLFNRPPFRISTYLLEGCVRFAKACGIEKVVVTSPRPVMVNILKSLGFSRITLEAEVIGESISPPLIPGPHGNNYLILTKDTSWIDKSEA